MGIHKKSGQNMKKNLEKEPDLERLASQPFQILDEKSKSRPCKNLASLNLESGTRPFLLKKVKKGEKRIMAVTHYQPSFWKLPRALDTS